MNESMLKIGHALGALALLALIVAAVLVVARLSDRCERSTGRRILVAAFGGVTFLLAAIGLVYPMVRTSYQSFFDQNSEGFVGAENYRWVLTDPGALTALRNTLMWIVIVPIISVALGFLYALLVDGKKGEGFLKALLFMPQAISFVGASVIWKFVYTYRQEGKSQIGLLNYLITLMGGTPHKFLVEVPWNNFFIMLVVIWTQAGFAMIILSGALKAIPPELIEAARIDGAGGWTIFRRITIPLVRPSLVVVLTTISVAMLKLFDVVRTMTGGQYDTSVFANMMYDQSFRYSQPGRGAAIAVLLLLMVIPIMMINVIQLRKNREIR